MTEHRRRSRSWSIGACLEHLAMLGLSGLAIVGAATVQTSTLRLSRYTVLNPM